MIRQSGFHLWRAVGLAGRAVLLPVVLVLVPTVAGAYHGALSSADSGIVGTGNWIAAGPVSLEWWVTQNPGGSWHYRYVFSHPVGATSHFILECSDSFTMADILGSSGDFSQVTVGEIRPQSGNPGMPEALFGIKFDSASGLVTRVEFDCTRQPVWGDFYSKDGNAGGQGVNAAWNAGFTVNDQDPADAPSDGSIGAHVLAPDTVGGVSPVRGVTWGAVKAMYR